LPVGTLLGGPLAPPVVAEVAVPASALPEEGQPVVHAYILIQTEVGKAAAVAASISEISGVTKAEDVTGPYDVIVRAEANTVDELGRLVVARVQSVDGITRTLTCPVVNI
jgi:DNA-binding Lrp family transcriptional regulator